MIEKDVTMLRVFGRGLLVDGTIDVFSRSDDCDDAAAGEDVFTLLPEVSLFFSCFSFKM